MIAVASALPVVQNTITPISVPIVTTKRSSSLDLKYAVRYAVSFKIISTVNIPLKMVLAF